jgi:energy-coupling factor transport system substrate-specific component
VKKYHLFIVLILCVGVASFIIPAFNVEPLTAVFNWSITATLLVILTVIAFFYQFELSTVNSKQIALTAMLGTISAVLRIPFVAIPNVQPCTYIIICTGYVFGPVAGFMVGTLTPLVSNFFLGHGPWTPYQMFAWGLIGMTSTFIKRANGNRWLLIIFGAACGYLFGWVMNVWYWTAFIHPLTIQTFFVTQFTTIWFDTMHATANAFFLGILGPRTIAILERFKKRFSWNAVVD